MASGYAPLWRRLLHKTPLFKRQRCGNYHWRWDRLCFCMVGEHCVTKVPELSWHGGILDLKTGAEYLERNQEIERIERDAARYRYLRTSYQYSGWDKHRLEWYLPRTYAEKPLHYQLDETIDDAMRPR